ncbi:heme lyase CcmF/NrfE family subunit [Limibaculum sp. M0105]|uniref:Heme lyase CcmF/NrfE family subunit n=1 Tax=Thermohalobaculum xanthum TaxID=2753746 RepID=A0A8J7M5N6_9RHOB|nr:heme lyase CcmF/NrfE family subunit [Thermohalobaculum xanthum]MBK0398966.1 heme lyase CcmF/NrfE family subunit [Thermohalobaculum xanthum]
MIVEIGHFALTLAFAVALFQMTIPLFGAARGWSDWMRTAAPAAMMQFLLTGIAFAALTHAFVVSDFSVRLVATNSHSLKPMLYKISGTWGNHEGSMLLWVLILTLFGAMVAAFGRDLPLGLKARALSVQAMIGAAFLAFILFTSNPFERLVPPPLDGNDLNPLLQDPGLAFHPPFLYLGYVGLSMSFSFAIAALIEGRVDAAWARWVRPWTLAAWIALTLGIALGSYWAYYELGWGGWWFWDPVENASFMPWLIAAALLHSAIVVEKRSALKTWTILLAIIAFSLSLVGTFIVRSGVLTSVHAFATDPDRGVFILAILAVATVGSLTLFAWRAPSMKADGMFRPFSREGALIYNNLMLAVAAAVVFAGTLAPLVREFVDGAKISVGAPFFDLAFTPFMVMLFVALPLGSIMAWKRADFGRVVSRLWWAAALSLALGGIIWGLQSGDALLAPVGLALGAWMVLGSIVELIDRAGWPRTGLGGFRRLSRLPRAEWGKWIAHSGLAVTVCGIAAITAWEQEDIRLARPGDVIDIGGYEIVFEGVTALPLGAPFEVANCGAGQESVLKGGEGRNFTTDLGRFSLRRGGREVAQLCAEKRFYPVQRMPTTEAAIDSNLLRDVYVVLGDKQTEGDAWAVRAYVKPLAVWIWLGALIMGVGGMVSLSDRRYRVGAAAKARPAAPALPAE